MHEIPSDVLRLAFEATNAGAWLADHEVGSVTFSERACEIFGVEPTEQISRDVLISRIHPDDRAAFDQAGSLAVDVGGDGRLDRTYRVVRPDGTICWARDLARTWFNPDRTRPTVSAGIIIDVTERNIETEARTGREAGFRRMANASLDLIERFDLHGRLVFANQARERAFGRTGAEDRGKSLAQLGLPAEVASRWERQLHQVVATRAPISFSHATTQDIGEAHRYHVRVVPELDDDGEVESVLIIRTDLTQRERLLTPDEGK